MKFSVFLAVTCFAATLSIVVSEAEWSYAGLKRDAEPDGEESPPALTSTPGGAHAGSSPPAYTKQAYYQHPSYSYYSGYPNGYQQPGAPYSYYYGQQYSGQQYSPYPYYQPYQSQGVAHKHIYSKPNEVHNYAQKGPYFSYHGKENDAHVLSSVYELNPDDSSFQYSYETDNGLSSEAHGYLKGENQVIQGSYTAPNQDGKLTKISYTADENGYNPSGEGIPTTPPIIAKALAYLRSLPPTPESPHSGKYYPSRYGGASV